jgi:hypothetical protein
MEVAVGKPSRAVLGIPVLARRKVAQNDLLKRGVQEQALEEAVVR